MSMMSLLCPLALNTTICAMNRRSMGRFGIFRLLRGCRLAFTAIAPSLLRLLSPCFSRVGLPSLGCLKMSTRTSRARLLRQFEGSMPGTAFVGLCKPARTAVCYAYCHVPTSSGYGRCGKVITVKGPFPNVHTVVTSRRKGRLPRKRAKRL